ncbi:MAG: rhomboid family intramembrane serine protease [candidate division NC10 bacterium]|nr:rhomboid family intramembrane serine protease [candidate division NC10 bacterium]
MNETSEIPLRVAPRRTLAEEWALVLVAQGLSPSIWPTDEGFVLGVPSEEVEQAIGALYAYESENPAEPQEGEEVAGSAHLYAALGVSVALVVFFFITGARNPTVRWFERGSADAERILLGELWRTVTSLTLHADLGHVMANAIAGAIFLSAVCRVLGPGLGSTLVLLAGAGGNFANALLHGSLHVSVGASTSVFGAVGLLGGLGVAQRRRRGARGRRAWMPIAAGFALLAMLGMGERVDLSAHLFGFLVGGILGILAALVVPRPPGPHLQWTFGGAALGMLIYCWALALG